MSIGSIHWRNAECEMIAKRCCNSDYPKAATAHAPNQARQLTLAFVSRLPHRCASARVKHHCDLHAIVRREKLLETT
jgi:hypothetical protein